MQFGTIVGLIARINLSSCRPLHHVIVEEHLFHVFAKQSSFDIFHWFSMNLHTILSLLQAMTLTLDLSPVVV